MLYFNYPYNNVYTPCSNCVYSLTRHNLMGGDVGKSVSLGSVELGEQKLMPEKFSISYPFVPNSDNSNIAAEINKTIINEVNELFKEQVLRPEAVDFNEVLGTYEIMVNQKGILSVLFSMYTYVNRAAHGFTAYSSLTVNTETGEVYNFEDLFNPKFNYIPVINELAQQYIRDKDIQFIEEYKGVTANQQFYLTPDSLVLYYQVYEYTPYSYGLFRIEIPYTKIANMLSPLSPIAKLVR